MKGRIFRSLSLVALGAILLSSALAVAVIFPHFNAEMRKEIQAQTAYLSAGLNRAEDKLQFLKDPQIEDSVTRVTLVAGDGTVLFDNRANPENMDNHRSRPEVAEALQKGSAQSVHLSQTLGTQTFYYAVRLEDGTILRLASTTGNFYTALLSVLPYLLPIIAAVFLLSLFLAKKITGFILKPINTLNLENPAANDVYEELMPLLSRIKAQNQQIHRQMEELKARQEDFAAITSHMSEGLIVVDGKGHILTVNQSAVHLLSADGFPYEGKNILALNRNLTLQEAVRTALQGEHFDEQLAVKNRTLRVFASPVYDQETVKGAILLVMDVTEQQKAEKIRREFSANVSHELKTPLTSISGYAELLKNGLVKPADIPSFAERIYSEALHMIHLVDNIIKLSGLEEKKIQPAKEEVDLLAMAEKVSLRLKPQADEKKIPFFVSGDPVKIVAVKEMIDELITNLCENGLKYNKPQGRVDIRISQQEGEAVLVVADTGIGIPAEHQARVFERFYRVDKSHSKQTGGTGLGLSIVKHIAEYHEARIQLESREGFGTKITVIFPQAK